ncbi:hypothetical protein CspHIS471_0304710 [Cutaneotrichosporon sp. HIS471]|nr:hypothetical protein CspHIS471_0304710 [Cutaneotrichosporon sp. HIS471]
MANTTKPTIGLIGASGLLGSAVLKALTTQQAKRIVLHRPSSKLPALDAETQTRALDIGGSEAEVHKALEGIDVLINASSRTDPAVDAAFLSHLANLPKPLKAYIPSDFSLNFTPDETRDVAFIEGKETLIARARELGIPTTTVHNGTFEPFVLTPFSGIDIAAGTLTLYGDAENRALPITSPAYLAAAVAEIAQLPTLESQYTVVEYTATGREIAAALEAAGGKKVVIKTFTPEEAAAAKAAGGLDALSAAVRVKWGKGQWPEPGAYTPAAPKRDITKAVKDALGKSA